MRITLYIEGHCIEFPIDFPVHAKWRLNDDSDAHSHGPIRQNLREVGYFCVPRFMSLAKKSDELMTVRPLDNLLPLLFDLGSLLTFFHLI